MSKRFVQIGLLVLAIPFTSLTLTNFTSLSPTGLHNFTSSANAANSTDYDQLVIEWQNAQEKLSGVIKASEDLKTSATTAETDISSQKNKIRLNNL